MNQILVNFSRLVTARPYITIIALVAITVVLAAGTTFRAPPTEGADVAFLPPGHAVVSATEEINALFSESGDVSIVTVIFRGDALTPGGMSQMGALLNAIAADPAVGGLLAPSDPIISPSFLVQAALQRQSLDGITQAEIDAVRNIPQIQGAIDAMTGTDTDGTPVAIANIRLIDTGDERGETTRNEESNELGGGQPGRAEREQPIDRDCGGRVQGSDGDGHGRR